MHHAKSSYYGRAFAEANSVSVPGVLGLLAYLLLATPADLAADVVFDDGQQHTIDYGIVEPIYIRDAFNGSHSHVDVSDGAVFANTVTLEGHSTLSMTGGEIGYVLGAPYASLTAFEYSRVDIKGGIVNDFRALGNSSIALSGTASLEYGSAMESSAIQISEDTEIERLHIGEDAEVLIDGGTIGTLSIHGAKRVEISGGTFQTIEGFRGRDHSCISGGVFESPIRFYGPNEISGGQFNGHLELGGFDAEFTFVGKDFAIDGVPVDLLESDTYGLTEIDWMGVTALTGVITGTLADGTPLNQTLYICDLDGEEEHYTYGKLHFIPEPASLALVALGGGWVMRRRRRA